MKHKTARFEEAIRNEMHNGIDSAVLECNKEGIQPSSLSHNDDGNDKSNELVVSNSDSQFQQCIKSFRSNDYVYYLGFGKNLTTPWAPDNQPKNFVIDKTRVIVLHFQINEPKDVKLREP